MLILYLLVYQGLCHEGSLAKRRQEKDAMARQEEQTDRVKEEEKQGVRTLRVIHTCVPVKGWRFSSTSGCPRAWTVQFLPGKHNLVNPVSSGAGGLTGTCSAQFGLQPHRWVSAEQGQHHFQCALHDWDLQPELPAVPVSLREHHFSGCSFSQPSFTTDMVQLLHDPKEHQDEPAGPGHARSSL